MQRCDRCLAGRSNRWYGAFTLHPPHVWCTSASGGSSLTTLSVHETKLLGRIFDVLFNKSFGERTRPSRRPRLVVIFLTGAGRRHDARPSPPAPPRLSLSLSVGERLWCAVHHKIACPLVGHRGAFYLMDNY